MAAVIFFGFNSFITHKRGVENVILNQSKALECKKYYISFDEKYRKYEYENIECYSIKNNIFFPIVLNVLVIYLSIINSGLRIHSHNYLFSLVSLCRIDLFSVHDGLCYQYCKINNSVGKVKYLILFFIEKFVYRRAKKIHVISDFTKDNCLLGSRELKKVIKIYNTVPFVLEKLSDEKHKSTDLGNEKRNVLIVRSIEERALLPMIFEVATQMLDFEFVICGKGPLLEQYRNDIADRDINNVFLQGFVDDALLAQYYINADIVVVPALYGEGFGLPVIEGYLFNKPVIASDVCALPEVIIDPNWLFDNTVNDLLNKLESFVFIERDKRFKEYYVENFGFSSYQNKMSKLYKELDFV
ncbi:glycosyltransferase family 4 protein [Vibrio sp. SM6]|uniref:Glycosyltransferase family 4 protein n=1 Tax=Vibrio agarilyticus TaxID=2726741 RepID=A0A7X8TS00_9VIBR|nr:glycosyltransferase family 4 protein [Vibrio agarilyticus]NLS13532.1 glycosyltransferase family 4 protein [Vibrio agarilyticus]